MNSKQRNLRILLVEDVEHDATFINHELDRGGFIFDARRVETREEFLRELATAQPDLILSDHGLPEFSGFEALNLVQERCPDTPFIFVTASDSEDEEQTALRCGARAWVRKSNLPTLVPIVREALQLNEERSQRRLAEQKIREHAAHLRLLSGELKTHALITLDSDGCVTEWSPGAAALFGFSVDKIVGRHFGCFYRPEDREVGKPVRDLEKAATSGRCEEEGWRVREDGTQSWMHTALTIKYGGGGRPAGFVYVLHDRTTERRSEETLRENAASYRLLFEQCPVALLVISEGRIVVANLAAQQLLGVADPAAFEGTVVTKLAREEDRAPLGAWLAAFEAGKKTKSRQTTTTEKMLQRSDGCVVCVRLIASRLKVRDEPAVLLALHDLTGEELACDLRTQALVAEERHACQLQLAAILSASPDAVITADHDARVLDWNNTAAELFGRSRSAVVGRPISEMLGAPSLTAPGLAELARHLAAKSRNTSPVGDQIVVRRADGEALVAELFIRKSPPALPQFYTLFLRIGAIGCETNSSMGDLPDERDAYSPLVPLSDPTRIFIDELRSRDPADPPAIGGDRRDHTGGRPPGVQRGPLERAHNATQATAEARRSIGVIISNTRTPWGERGLLSRSEVEELERVIRLLEVRLDERELALAAAETKLVNQNRDLVEAEALLKARQELLTAMQSQPIPTVTSLDSAFSAEKLEALHNLKHELERQADSLTETREALRTREEFIEHSEAALMEKIQAQQEREIELDQREENLRANLRRTGVPDPVIDHEPVACAVA